MCIVCEQRIRREFRSMGFNEPKPWNEKNILNKMLYYIWKVAGTIMYVAFFMLVGWWLLGIFGRSVAGNIHHYNSPLDSK